LHVLYAAHTYLVIPTAHLADRLEVLEALKRADRKLKADAAREQDREREWEQKLARAQSSAAESKYGAVVWNQ